METTKVISDSKERVALELMQYIALKVSKSALDKEATLTLYRQCLLVVTGNKVATAMAEEKKSGS